jgi:TP901 family phage tail tape measure protein
VALNNLGLGFIFTARDLASGTITRVGGAFGTMDRNALRAQASYQRNFAVMGAGLAIMGAGAATLAGAFGLAEAAGEFELEIARVGGIAQATAEDLVLLRAAAIHAGAFSGFSPVQATEALGALASMGFNTAQSLALMDPALTLAAGGMISAEQAAMSLAAATHVFGLDMEGAALAADQMLRISNSTALAAGDMELAIGTVARGARLTHQSIEEMLPAIGLLRNTGLDVSVAAQSVSSALTFMSGRADAIRQTLGVELTETMADGSIVFRDFMDIAIEAGTALEERFADPAERTAMATELFSRFGVGAVTGVFDALRNGVRDSEGRLYQGAEAIAFLRSEMTDAAGAAEEFRNRLLDTFEGQQQLLGAAASTLGILLGEGFTRGFRPYVEGTLAMIQRVVGFLEEIPVEVRGAISAAVIAAGGLTFAFGGLIALGAALALLAPFISAIAVATGYLLLAMVPFVALAATVLGVAYAFERLTAVNIDFREALQRSYAEARLVFRGLVQLFTTGELSGAIAEELSRAENEGILGFIVDLYAIGFRLVQFFRGIGIGFDEGMGTIGPAVERMWGAFRRLGEALGLVSAEGREAVAGMPSEEFANTGARIGAALAGVFELLVDMLTEGARFLTDFTHGWQEFFAGVTPGFDRFMPALTNLQLQLSELLISLGVMGENGAEGGDAMLGLGEILGMVAGGSLDFFVFVLGNAMEMASALIWTVRQLVEVFEAMPRIFSFVGTAVETLFLNILDGFMYLVESMIAGMGSLVSMVPASLRTPDMNAIVGAGEAAGARADARLNAINSRGRAVDAARAAVFPAGAEAEARAGGEARTEAALGGVARLLERQAEERASMPWEVSIAVDGEAIARATGRGERRDDAASFGMTPAES